MKEAHQSVSQSCDEMVLASGGFAFFYRAKCLLAHLVRVEYMGRGSWESIHFSLAWWR
jgi:hypothetical protein